MQSGGGIIPDSDLEIRGYSWMQWCTCRLSKHYVILSWWERRCVRKGKMWAEVLANPETICFPTISCWISGNKNSVIIHRAVQAGRDLGRALVWPAAQSRSIRNSDHIVQGFVVSGLENFQEQRFCNVSGQFVPMFNYPPSDSPVPPPLYPAGTFCVSVSL